MPANVESMFSVREKPWHGLGTIVVEAPNSSAALELAGLDWTVIQKDIATADGGKVIPGFKANVRELDDKVLGMPTASSMRCRILQHIPNLFVSAAITVNRCLQRRWTAIPSLTSHIR